MEFALLGWPEAGPTLDLDYRRFAYAGKFVMSNTGKAVVREDDAVVAAVAFNADRTDPDAVWLRYVTVREDRRGEGIGPRLIAFAVARLRERFRTVRIAVNNPFAYEALYRAGFGYAGEETGIAELVLAFPAPGDSRTRERYQAGLDVYRGRDLSPEERAFLDRHADADPPDPVDAPEGREG
jgi:GNAT superfamily N-acetyltransferase